MGEYYSWVNINKYQGVTATARKLLSECKGFDDEYI